jgi:hypothetical protein
MVKVPTPSPGGPGLGTWWIVAALSTVFSLEEVVMQGSWSNMLHLLTTPDSGNRWCGCRSLGNILLEEVEVAGLDEAIGVSA